MIADFVGDALFSDNGSGLEGIIKNADTKERGAIRQFLHDFISYLKKKISGNREISFEVSRLEDMFNRMFTDATEKTSDNQMEKNSLAGESARTSNKSLLEIAKLEQREADDNTGIGLSQDITKYPYNMQTVIKEYISSADKSVEDFINAFNTNKRFARHKISNVTENQAADIKRLLGIDVSGYTNSINTNAIRHIEKRHGENGIADSSMSNILDIARIGYVLEN